MKYLPLLALLTISPASAEVLWPTYDLRAACVQMLTPRVLPGTLAPAPDPRIVATCVNANEATKRVLNHSYMWENMHDDAKLVCAQPFGSANTYDDYINCVGRNQ